jgi:ribosomal protein L20A (L18A)
MKVGGEITSFSKIITANKKESAVSKLRSIFGSNYKIKRQMIKIDSVEETT